MLGERVNLWRGAPVQLLKHPGLSISADSAKQSEANICRLFFLPHRYNSLLKSGGRRARCRPDDRSCRVLQRFSNAESCHGNVSATDTRERVLAA